MAARTHGCRPKWVSIRGMPHCHMADALIPNPPCLDSESRLMDTIANVIQQSIQAQQAMLDTCLPVIRKVADAMVATLNSGGTIYLMGCGGSAADAQHVAGELIGRFKMERRGLPCVAMTTDTSILTSIGNDYGFEEVFVRQVEGLVREGDLVVGISTSGNTKAVLKAIALAQEMGATTVGFTGESGGRLKDAADLCFCAPTGDTPHVQECHITVWHVLCGVVEQEVCGP